MSSLLIRAAEVAGSAHRDVRVREGRIVELDTRLHRLPGETLIDAEGSALLPGLHDHHIHLLALAAAMRSIRCGPPEVSHEEALATALRLADAEAGSAGQSGDWLRGVGYHESVAGELDRSKLDAWVNERPVRIQHRSGALWVLNSRAIERLEPERGPLPDGVERDARGALTGRIYRADDWLRERIGEERPPELARVGALLSRYGVTGLADATPGNGRSELARLSAAVAAGELPQALLVMGTQALPPSTQPGVRRGPLKLMLDENALPSIETLSATIQQAHGTGRAVAIHCVTRAELVVAAAALAEAPCREGDRIEHASVAPPELIELLAPLPLTVVTQPNFIHERGDAYIADVEARDQPWLYRCRGFIEARLPLAGGTDAPFGQPDPWAAMRAAVDRRSASGISMGQAEALSPEEALALFTSPLSAPGQATPELMVGSVADLCLLDRPWSKARDELDASSVRASILDGQVTFCRDDAGSEG